MKVGKACYMVLGCIGLALGAVGAVVPLMPAFPFLMLALVCFAKGSDRLHSWFLETKLYRNNLEGYVKTRGMTWRTKIRIMATVTVVMAISFFLVLRDIPIAQAILATVWLFHIFYFVGAVKTVEEPGCAAPADETTMPQQDRLQLEEA